MTNNIYNYLFRLLTLRCGCENLQFADGRNSDLRNRSRATSILLAIVNALVHLFLLPFHFHFFVHSLPMLLRSHLAYIFSRQVQA